jgi:hypothetical protein
VARDKLVLKGILCILLPFLAASSACAQWHRIVTSWNGETGIYKKNTTTSPHPISFFLSPLPARDPDNGLCLGCDQDGHKVTLKDFSIQASQRELGESYGRKIIEIMLSFRAPLSTVQFGGAPAPPDDNALPNATDPVAIWKSVLMESSPGLYRELYFLIDNGNFVRPLSHATLVNIGSTKALSSTDFIEGNGGFCTESEWALLKDGPHLIDFFAVQKEIDRLTPARAAPPESGCYALSMEKAEIRTAVQLKNAHCHACDYLGWIEVHFKLDGYKALPASSSFDPDMDD